MNTQYLPALLSLFLFVFASGCGTTGPSYETTKNQLPPLAPNKCRIFFYRPSWPGAAMPVEVGVDGKYIGHLPYRGFVYTDLTPGNHRLTNMQEAWIPVADTNNDTIYPNTGYLMRRYTEGIEVVNVLKATAWEDFSVGSGSSQFIRVTISNHWFVPVDNRTGEREISKCGHSR